MPLGHFGKAQQTINLSMIFGRASAGTAESLDFSDISMSQEPPGARAEA